MSFKKILFSICCLLLLASCKDEKPNLQNDTTDIKVKDKKEFESIKHSNKALILIDNLVLYDKMLTVISETKNHYGKLVTIDSISKKRININGKGDNCNEYNLVHIANPKFNGWIEGKDIFEYLHDKRDTTFTINNVKFKLFATKNFAIDASDDDGLTFCGDNNPVVLYNSKFGFESFVPVEKHSDYSDGYMVMDDFDGWMDKIKSVGFKDDVLTVVIFREYQEDSADITLEIKLLPNGYKGKVISYVHHEQEFETEN
ncbi:MAG: hypothetical protein ACLGH8_00510 [Bacteroidia bacterium]